MNTIPRPEHPRPQFRREDWQSLNGPWEFQLDQSHSGTEQGFPAPGATFPSPRTIQVPFCPQSRLSGIEYKDFIRGCWYRRSFTVEPERFTHGSLKTLLRLHFGAVDYEATVYINGQLAGHHVGGYTSFELEISHLVVPGENILTLYAADDERDPLIPRGKQSELFHSHGCDYTRTTGIWQSVYLEYVPKTHIESVKITTTDGDPSGIVLQVAVSGQDSLRVQAAWKGKAVGTAATPACGTIHDGILENGTAPDGTIRPGTAVTVTLPLSEVHLWRVGVGGLYDLTLSFGEDVVHSYFGLRTVELTEKAVLINGKPVFQRLVLDQGFYPEGIYTAPTDAELAGDIEKSMAMGFNGARLHQKTFEERFLYHADRLGYLVWGEYGNWGLDHTDPMAIYSFLPAWLEEMARDGNHPSLIGWCPFNETWDNHYQRQYDPLLKLVYQVTKAADVTRPVIDVSGAYHVATDIYDHHDYVQDPAVLAAHFPKEKDPGKSPESYRENRLGGAAYRFHDEHEPRQFYQSGPVFVSEYGGIGYDPDKALSSNTSEANVAWSYGTAAHSEEEYITRFRGLAEVLLRNPNVMGFCYTQLTDVEQEQNGVYTYERVPKVDPAVFHEILSQTAAIEK